MLLVLPPPLPHGLLPRSLIPFRQLFVSGRAITPTTDRRNEVANTTNGKPVADIRVGRIITAISQNSPTDEGAFYDLPSPLPGRPPAPPQPARRPAATPRAPTRPPPANRPHRLDSPAAPSCQRYHQLTGESQTKRTISLTSASTGLAWRYDGSCELLAGAWWRSLFLERQHQVADDSGT